MDDKNVYSMLMDAPFSFVLHRIIDDGGADKTIDFEFIIVNPVFENTFGIGNELLQGKTVKQLFPVNENFGLRSIYDKISCGNFTTTFEHYIAGSGHLYQVNAWLTSEHLLAITLTEILSVRKSNEPGYLKDIQYQMLWNNNLFGVIIADKNGNYVDANQEACRMTGYSCDELKTMNVLSLSDPDKKEEYSIHFEQIVKTGKAYGEAAYFTKSGEKRWWNVVATRLSDEYFLGMHEDITKRKHAEEKLRQLAQVSAASTDIIVVIGADYCYKYANEVYLKKRNLHPEDIIGHHMIDIVGVEKFEELGKSQVDAALRGEMVESLEWSDFGGNEQHYLNVHVAPYREDDGTITGVVMSGREITEQKRAEEELEISERRFSQLIQNSYDTIVILDADGIQRYVSPSAEKVHGYSTKELVDIPVIEVMIHPDDQAGVLATFQTIIESGSGSVQYRHRRKGGGWVYLEAYCTNQLENPDIKGIVVNIRDITERKQAEESLKKSESEYRNLFENANDAIFIMDPKTEIILDANNKSCEMYGFSKEEFIGTSLKDLSIDVKSGEEKIEHTLKNGIYNNFESSQLNKMGEVIHLLVNASVIDYRGKKAILSINRDITERKLTDQKMRESEALLARSQQIAHVGSWKLDAHASHLEWSDEVFRIFDCEPKDFGGTIEAFFDFVHPDDREMVDEAFNSSLRENRDSYEIIHRIVRKTTGETRYVHERATHFYDADRVYKYSIGVVQDITEQKHHEAELKQIQKNLAEKEAQYRLLAENSQDLIYVYTLVPEPRYEYISPSCLQITGYRPEEGYADPFAYHKFINTPEGIERFTKFILDPNQPNVIEEEWKRKDGSSIWVEQVVSRNFDENGQLISFQSTVRDISKRKQDQEKIRYTKDTYESIFNSVSEAIYVLDEHGNFIEVNQGAEKMYGYSRDELIGKSPTDVSAPGMNNMEEVNRIIQKVALTGISKNFDFWGVKKNGEVFLKDVCINRVIYYGKEHILATARDITERKRTEDKLIESEEKYRLISESTIDIIFILDKKGNQVFFNKSVERILGYKVEDLIGKSFTSFIPISEIPRYLSKLKDVFLNKEVKDFVTQVYHKDRHLVEVEINGRLIKNKGEYFAQGSIREITDRKKAEAELKASEKKFRELSTLMRLMTDNMPDMLWAKNLKKEYIFTNKALCNNLLGAEDTNEPLGKTDMFFAMRQRNSQPDNLQWHTFGEICRDSDSITMQELKPMQFDEYGNVKGNFLYLDVRKAPLYDEHGQLIGVVGSARDITERKALEDKLLQQTRLRELLMEISSGFINIPLDRVEGSVYEALCKMGRFVNADRAYTFDYDWQNEVCHNTYEWCNEGISAQIQNLQNIPLSIMNEAVEEHKMGNTVCIHDVSTLPEGKARQLVELQEVLSFIMVPMMNENHCLGFVGFDSVRKKHEYSQAEIHLLRLFAQSLANIKLRQIMEEQLVDAKEQAEESDRLKSAFLANMSHEIRTPMNGILGFAELLKRPDLSGSVQHDYIEIIERSGKRMLNIINDIIDISKIESGLMEVKMLESNMSEQLEYVHAFFKPEAEAKGLRFSINNALTRTEATLTTDREKVYAILTNLIKNAIKYTHEGMIELGCSLKGDIVEFYVKDTGIGISKDRMEAIFERFIQADIEDRMAYQGAGLGLAITKAYIEMLGGAIWVESELGKGSTFYFTLPFKSGSKKIINSMNSMVNDINEEPRKLKILVVEDDYVSELLFDAMFTAYSKEILKARSGIEAVEMAKNNPDIDLILMDIQLPEFNGHEATRRIRQFNTKVVIIAQTAFGLTGDRERALEAGCTDYISKPIDRNELNRLIIKYFNNH